MYVCVCMYIYIYMYTCVCVCVCVFVNLVVHIYVCIYIYIYTHTIIYVCVKSNSVANKQCSYLGIEISRSRNRPLYKTTLMSIVITTSITITTIVIDTC